MVDPEVTKRNYNFFPQTLMEKKIKKQNKNKTQVILVSIPENSVTINTLARSYDSYSLFSHIP